MSAAPGTLVELATMAQIEVTDLAAFTEADFDELAVGLGVSIGARLKLRTQFREMDRGAPRWVHKYA